MLQGKRGGGQNWREEGADERHESCRELPKLYKNGGKRRVAVSYYDVTEIGSNGGREGAAASCHKMLGNERHGEAAVSCHKVPESGTNEGVGGAAFSCRELSGCGRNGWRGGAAGS